MGVLNTVLHPVLSKWHPVLEDYESTKPAGVSPFNSMKGGGKRPRNCEMPRNDVRSKLMEYGAILAEVADVPSLLPQQHKTE